jgi:hypothetical protein
LIIFECSVVSRLETKSKAQKLVFRVLVYYLSLYSPPSCVDVWQRKKLSILIYIRIYFKKISNIKNLNANMRGLIVMIPSILFSEISMLSDKSRTYLIIVEFIFIRIRLNRKICLMRIILIYICHFTLQPLPLLTIIYSVSHFYCPTDGSLPIFNFEIL